MKHEQFPGLAVSLTVDGQKLPEHTDEENDDFDTETTSCYVEASSGANFCLDFEAPFNLARQPQDYVNTSISMDGKHIHGAGRLLPIGDVRHNRQRGLYKYRFEGAENNTLTGTAFAKFTFADLETNDGPTENTKKKDFKELGQIKVTCTWGRQLDVRPASIVANPNSRSTAPIPEKCLKGRAISKQATLGKPEHRAGSVNVATVNYPYGSSPFATFVFNYRSRRDLQVEGMIPRSPSPVPLEERDPKDLSPEELQELVRRMRAREAEHTQVKREKRERSITLDDDDDEEVGVEVLVTRSKRRRVSDDSAIDVVDLTED